ncbi:MAG: hypothetical protein WA655_15285 [Candidatus Korobacteraceae bacterium]
MKEGDLIRVVRLPDGVQDSERFSTRAILERCVGHVFPVMGMNNVGYLQIDVGEVVGKPSYMESIWIEPECVELVKE